MNGGWRERFGVPSYPLKKWGASWSDKFLSFRFPTHMIKLKDMYYIHTIIYNWSTWGPFFGFKMIYMSFKSFKSFVSNWMVGFEHQRWWSEYQEMRAENQWIHGYEIVTIVVWKKHGDTDVYMGLSENGVPQIWWLIWQFGRYTQYTPFSAIP